MSKPRVLILRGTSANPWELSAWEPLLESYEVSVALPPNNQFDVSSSIVPKLEVRTVGGYLRGGTVGRLMTRLVGERYVGLDAAISGADVVHAAELGYWFTAQAARLRSQGSFKLVVTAWETIPFLGSYRNLRTRPYRDLVLSETDLFLATTERSRSALLLEGAPSDRVSVSYPGIDVGRYAAPATGGASPRDHLILSIGRLVWEKGHQDVIRALAELKRCGKAGVRLLIVGVGPEEKRLRGLAAELGVGPQVELRGWVPHRQLPALYREASCLVLASLPTMYWEEQFGMVLAEALASELQVVASDSGAIPEVLGGEGMLFPAGDWLGLSRQLAAGPLSAAPATRVTPARHILDRYSNGAAAARLAHAYESVLA